MRQTMIGLAAALLVLCGATSKAQARGFGRAGGGRAAAVGPRGGVAAGGYRGASYTGPRGGQVRAGAVGGARVGPYGGAAVGGARGVQVTTPGGRTFANAYRGGAAVTPGGRAVAGGARGAAVSGGFGGVAAVGRGGVAVGARGVGVRHGTFYAGSATLAARGVAIRGAPVTAFTRGWYTAHAGAWWPGRWAARSYWLAPAWGVLAPYCGVVVEGPPAAYDYGSTVVINDDRVYINGEAGPTADEYAQQAAAFADVGRAAKPGEGDEWQALGVFGLIQPDDQVAQQIFQLAINKEGVVRGNYYNALTDQTTLVYGALDKKSQRVAWSVGDRKDIVFEAGLYNLTEQQSTAVVHYGTERTVQMVLVRLEEPPSNGK
jgi:hypothetical protein